jgi:hypothetical protein
MKLVLANTNHILLGVCKRCLKLSMSQANEKLERLIWLIWPIRLLVLLGELQE